MIISRLSVEGRISFIERIRKDPGFYLICLEDFNPRSEMYPSFYTCCEYVRSLKLDQVVKVRMDLISIFYSRTFGTGIRCKKAKDIIPLD